MNTQTWMNALTFASFGDPDVLRYQRVRKPEVAPNQALIEMTAIGLNFADVYRRRGSYILAGSAPWIAGYEGAGRVVAIGSRVADLQIGQRVAFADVPRAQADFVSASADNLIPLPDDVSDVDAASLLLQGLTAQYLTEDCVTIKAGDTVVVHAAAGGVGRLITQYVASRGGKIIALASTDSKRTIALKSGAALAIDINSNWVDRVLNETDGGAEFVFDSVGTTISDSLAAARSGGRVVIFGKAGGEPPLIEPFSLALSSKGIIGGDLWTYLSSRQSRLERAGRLFQSLRRNEITRPNVQKFKLSDGVAANIRIEDRAFSGKVVMEP